MRYDIRDNRFLVPFLFQMYLHITCALVFIQAVTSVSIASTPSSYTNQATEESYASPSTVESAPPQYKVNNQYPYSRQLLEPLFTPSSQYAETFTPSSPTPAQSKQFLLHRVPFFPPYSSPYAQPPASYGEQPGYPQPPYNYPAYPPSQPLYDPSYPLNYPGQKYAASRNPYAPDCDFHPSFRNRPYFFYPSKQDPYLDSQVIARPGNSLFRFQPPAFANNIYN